MPKAWNTWRRWSLQGDASPALPQTRTRTATRCRDRSGGAGRYDLLPGKRRPADGGGVAQQGPELLDAGRVGLALTESCAMTPAAADLLKQLTKTKSVYVVHDNQTVGYGTMMKVMGRLSSAGFLTIEQVPPSPFPDGSGVVLE